MKQYLDLVRTVIEHGEQRPDRTGTDTLSVFGTQTKYQNHVEGLRQQRERAPFELPRARVADQPIDEIAFADIELVGHRHHPFIRLPIAV